MKTKAPWFFLLIALLFTNCREGPEDAFHRFMQSSMNGDWAAFYDLLDTESRLERKQISVPEEGRAIQSDYEFYLCN